jgi:hypothetical protein
MQGDVPRFHAPADARPDDVAWPPMSWPPIAHRELGGGAVVLRPYVDEDAAELFAALDDDRVWAHVAGRPGTPEALAVGMATRTAMDDPLVGSPGLCGFVGRWLGSPPAASSVRARIWR